MERDCSTTVMAERRDSSNSRSETGSSDTTSTVLSSSLYEYVDLEGSATIKPYHFEPENKADGQDSASTGISRARYTIMHFKHHHRVLQLISNRMSV